MFLRAEDQRQIVIGQSEFAAQIEWSVKGLFFFDTRAVGCADDQVAIDDGFIERAADPRVGQHVCGVDRRNDLAPHGRVWRYYDQIVETEILHRPRRRADVVRITRADKYDSSTWHFP